MDKSLSGYLWGLSTGYLLAAAGAFTLPNYLAAVLGTIVGAWLRPRIFSKKEVGEGEE